MPSQLEQAQEQHRLTGIRFHLAKSRIAQRDASEDLEFWSNKIAMLAAMADAGLSASAATTAREAQIVNLDNSATGGPPSPGQHWTEQGGTYIGIASAEGDLPARHVVVLDIEPPKKMEWAAAVKWAQAQGNGARLPTQLEALFAFTTCKAAFKPSWHWTGTQHSRDLAFVQYFEYGSSYWTSKDSEHRVRAFRGLALQPFATLNGVATSDTAENFLATVQA